jgi:murein DD-endopeptidase MepM/ murein hydrolase activator NlpD
MRETEDLERRVEALRADVEAIAVARFAASGSNGIPLLTGLQPPKDQVQAEVLGGVVNVTGASALDEFDLAEKQLAAKRRELAQQRSDVEAQRESFAALQAEADAEVVRLREIEEQRLTDEAVQRALEAQQAAELADYAEAVLRNAEAEARARPNPGVVAAQQAQQAQQAADEAAAADGADGADGAETDLTDLADAGAANVGGVAAPPVSTVAPNTGASGGTSGGRTGTGGPGSAPVGVVNGEVYLDAILCPMLGSAYGDSWGAPRSGGRRHEGVDMLAPTGTPIYAVVSGTVNFKQNRLGGNAVSLVGDNGNRYYYAHLSAYEGTSRRVAQGDVIGYNGDTGNATGVPHLHFEIHPGGGLAVNPFSSVRLAGC